MTNINELALASGELSRSMNAEAGLNPCSPVVIALSSGLDVAITIFEQATGARIHNFNRNSAEKVVKYFNEEAERSERIDPQIAIFYRAWAKAIALKFLASGQ